MKFLTFSSFFAIGLALVLVGCNKDNGGDPFANLTDEEIVQQQAIAIDSIADYSASDEAYLDDEGAQDRPDP